jgi:uncharacterized membrane protein
MTQLMIALGAFLGTHFLMSHPLRKPLVAKLGDNGFAIAYSVVAFATFGWAIWAFRAAPPSPPLWSAGSGLWGASTAIMLLASVLLVGSFVGNPALPQPGAEALMKQTPRGVFAITRHPMMWSFALWSLAHILVAPNKATLILSAAIAFLALVGSKAQDEKKAALVGDAWKDWAARTSYVPFARQITGGGWSAAWPGRTVMLAGIALWLIASWAHPWFGLPTAGIFRWTG